MPEIRTVWKSDHQGLKENTFSQTGRRGGDGPMGQGGNAGRQQLEDQEVPQLCVDKPGAIPGELRQTSKPKVPAWEKKASKPLPGKTCGGCGGGRKILPS